MINNTEISIYTLDYSIGCDSTYRAIKINNGVNILNSIIDDRKIMSVLGLRRTVSINNSYGNLDVILERSNEIYVHQAYYRKIRQILHKFQDDSICDELCIASLVVQRLNFYSVYWIERYMHGSARNETISFLRKLLNICQDASSTTTNRDQIAIDVGSYKTFEHGGSILRFLGNLIKSLEENHLLEQYSGISLNDILFPRNLQGSDSAKEFSRFIELARYEILIPVIDKAKILQKKKHYLLATMIDFCNVEEKPSKEYEKTNTEKEIGEQERNFILKNNLPPFVKTCRKA